MPYRILSALVVMVVACAGIPLYADCSASVSASVSNDVVIVTGSGGGSCAWSSIELFVEGTSIGSSFCNNSPTCELTRQFSISCMTEGPHEASVMVLCSQNIGANGACQNAPDGNKTTTFYVNTKPTVSLAITRPDTTGHGTFNVGYSFPGTTYNEFRALQLMKGGELWAATKAENQEGVWVVPFDTTCWKTGILNIFRFGLHKIIQNNTPVLQNCKTCKFKPNCLSEQCMTNYHKTCFRTCNSRSFWPGLFPSAGPFFPGGGC
jgi:hypothetical protein